MVRSNRKVLACCGCVVIFAAVLLSQHGEPTTAQPKTESPVEPVKALDSGFVVKPYLQFPTRESITIMWETARAGTSTVEYGSSSTAMTGKVAENKNVTLHEITLKELKPNSKYIYRVATTDMDGKTVTSDFLTFMTAVDEDSAFSFTVIGDTQRNPKMTGQIAQLMWERRPNFDWDRLQCVGIPAPET